MSKDKVSTKLPGEGIPNKEVFQEFIETQTRFRIYRYLETKKVWVPWFHEENIKTKQYAEQLIVQAGCIEANYAITKEVMVTMRPGVEHAKTKEKRP